MPDQKMKQPTRSLMTYTPKANDICHWCTAAKIVGVASLIALLFYPSLTALWQRWILWDQDLAHAIPTLLIVGYIFFTTHYQPVSADSRFIQAIWIFTSTFAAWCWAVFYSANISLLAYISLFITLITCLSAIFSSKFIGKALPILALLLFCIPIWDELNSGLVWLSTVIVGEIVRFSQLTALIDGQRIYLPFGTIFIADGCSGLRYFTISLLMGLLISLLNQYSKRMCLISMTIFGCIGLIANWVRIYLLVIIGYESQMTSSLMHDHEMFGWILFALMIFPAVYFAPIMSQDNRRLPIAKGQFIIPLIAVASAPLWVMASKQEQTTTLLLEHEILSPSTSITANRATQLGLTSTKQAQLSYKGTAFRLDWYQTKGSIDNNKIVPYVREIFTDQKNTLITQYSLDANHHGRFNIKIYKENRSNQHWIGVSQFHVGNSRVSTYKQAKLAQIKSILLDSKGFGLLVIQLNCADNCLSEQKNLPELLTALNVTTIEAYE